MKGKKIGTILAEYGSNNALFRARRKYPKYTIDRVKKIKGIKWTVYGHKRKSGSIK